MFVLSQYILKKSDVCNINNISTYAIAIGLVIYASIYLYFLFYNNEYLSIFNKFIIYIVGIDLLLSTFYYYNMENTLNNYEPINDIENPPHMRVIDEEDTNSDSDYQNKSDDEYLEEEDQEEETQDQEEEIQDQEEEIQDQEQIQEQIQDQEQIQQTQEQIQQTQEHKDEYHKDQEEHVEEENNNIITLDDTNTKNISLSEIETTPIKKKRGRKPKSG